MGFFMGVQIFPRFPPQVFLRPGGEVNRKTLARGWQINVKLTKSASAEGVYWLSDSCVLFLLDARTSGDWGV